MPIAKQKIVQSFISAFNEQARIIEAARIKLNDYKTKWQTLNPNLTDTNLTSQQASNVNSYIADLNTLADLPIVAVVESKNIPTHDTKGLD